MITEKQLSILSVFYPYIFREHSYNEIKNLSKVKSNNTFHRAMKKFISSRLLTVREAGGAKFYKMNIGNDDLYDYLSLISNKKLSRNAIFSLELLKKEIDKYDLFYSLVIFGSYAENVQKKESDIDIAIILPEKNIENKIKIAINSADKKTLINMDCHIITSKEFLEMLKANYENLGKQIARKNFPYFNIRAFYKLLERGVEDGFKL